MDCGTIDMTGDWKFNKWQTMAIHNVSLHDAKKQLANLIKRVEQGDEVIITQEDGRSIRLVLDERPKKRRIAGLYRGKVHMQDDFDEPLGDGFWLGSDR